MGPASEKRPLPSTAVRTLVLLKDAVREVTWTMHCEWLNGDVTDIKDRLEVSFRAILAIEAGVLRKYSRCSAQFPGGRPAGRT